MGLLPVKPAEVLLAYTGSANRPTGLSAPREGVPSGHRRPQNPGVCANPYIKSGAKGARIEEFVTEAIGGKRA